MIKTRKNVHALCKSYIKANTRERRPTYAYRDIRYKTHIRIHIIHIHTQKSNTAGR